MLFGCDEGKNHFYRVGDPASHLQMRGGGGGMPAISKTRSLVTQQCWGGGGGSLSSLEFPSSCVEVVTREP